MKKSKAPPNWTNNHLLKSGAIGAVTALSFAPFNFFPIFCGTFAWLFVRIFTVSRIKSLLIEAFCFFFFFHAACLYWVVNPLTFDLSKYWILIPFAITLIPAYLSVQLLIPILIMRKSVASSVTKQEIASIAIDQQMRWTKVGCLAYSSPILFASSFCLVMIFYGNLFPGFPWVLPGYIWSCHEVFMQTLSIYGIYGLSFVTTLISGFLGSFFLCYKLNDRKNMCILFTIPVLLFSFIVLFGCYRLSNNPTKFTDKKIIMVQCNIAQEDKHNPSYAAKNLRNHLNLSYHKSKVDFIIWPEAAIPYLYRENFTQLHDFLKSPLKDGEYLISGAVRKDLSTNKIYNSVVVVNSDGKNIINYDKAKLLPFGEYIPFRKYLPFRGIAADIGDFDAGEESGAIEINGVNVIFAICYEAVFSNNFIPYANRCQQITRRICGETGNKRADVIINATNDGWFGCTSEPFQHLQIVRARAIETGLPVLRSTNFGISAVFDPCGREIARIDIKQSGIVESNLPKKVHTDFYGQGRWSVLYVLLAMLLLSVVASKRSYNK